MGQREIGLLFEMKTMATKKQSYEDRVNNEIYDNK